MPSSPTTLADNAKCISACLPPGLYLPALVFLADKINSTPPVPPLVAPVLTGDSPIAGSISWTYSATNPDHWRVEYSITGTGGWTFEASVSGAATSYATANGPNYRIVGQDSGNNNVSLFSNTAVIAQVLLLSYDSGFDLAAWNIYGYTFDSQAFEYFDGSTWQTDTFFPDNTTRFTAPNVEGGTLHRLRIILSSVTVATSNEVSI